MTGSMSADALEVACVTLNVTFLKSMIPRLMSSSMASSSPGYRKGRKCQATGLTLLPTDAASVDGSWAPRHCSQPAPTLQRQLVERGVSLLSPSAPSTVGGRCTEMHRGQNARQLHKTEMRNHRAAVLWSPPPAIQGWTLALCPRTARLADTFSNDPVHPLTRNK